MLHLGSLCLKCALVLIRGKAGARFLLASSGPDNRCRYLAQELVMVKPRDIWTHRDSRMVLELREKNYTIRKIAAELNCSTSHVQKAIKGEL